MGVNFDNQAFEQKDLQEFLEKVKNQTLLQKPSEKLDLSDMKDLLNVDVPPPDKLKRTSKMSSIKGGVRATMENTVEKIKHFKEQSGGSGLSLNRGVSEVLSAHIEDQIIEDGDVDFNENLIKQRLKQAIASRVQSKKSRDSVVTHGSSQKLSHKQSELEQLEELTEELTESEFTEETKSKMQTGMQSVEETSFKSSDEGPIELSKAKSVMGPSNLRQSKESSDVDGLKSKQVTFMAIKENSDSGNPKITVKNAAYNTEKPHTAGFNEYQTKRKSMQNQQTLDEMESSQIYNRVFKEAIKKPSTSEGLEAKSKSIPDSKSKTSIAADKDNSKKKDKDQA